MDDVTVLPNSIFDNGSLEYRNFQVSTQEDYHLMEWHSIEKFYPELIYAIRMAFSAKKHHVDVSHLKVQRVGSTILEISWD